MAGETESDHQTLYVAPMLRIGTTPPGKLLLTRKFIEGINFYVDHWPGPVVVLSQPQIESDDNLDHVECDASELRFGVEFASFTDEVALAKILKDARLVLGSLEAVQANWAPLCRRLGVALVYIGEYSPRTKKQIIDAEVRNPLRRLVRRLRVDRNEARCFAAAPLASGIQCNGTPVFEAYKSLNSRTLLYFDTRTTQEMLATDADLEARTKQLLAGGPLRLAFSGRIKAMKGAQFLPAVAAELARRQVPFTFDICGDGELRAQIESKVRSLNLTDRVRFHGVLDFHKQLMPLLRSSVDLFVCCHPQGDPSCTYLETMACGVPIAGFANEAFVGLVEVARAGWLSPLNQPIALARKIAKLNANRSTLALVAGASRDFAAKHTFELTFEARIEHLLQCAASPVV
jgi:colanic acid/amylovoran biosynthesis glycosyltransferase